MLFDSAGAAPPAADYLIDTGQEQHWGVESETGRLTDVLLSAPRHLRLVPCNDAARASLASGLDCCTATAGRQHGGLVEALESEGVCCHFVPPAADLPDLAFTRDAVLMTPWGLIELRPAAPHRQAEAALVRDAVRGLGVPWLGRVREGTIEGGDVCILRPGVVLIGYSGDRTNRMGARALARLFQERGWHVVHVCFDSRFLHLDTQFTMLSPGRAVACVETLGLGFAERMRDLGIELVPVTAEEVAALGANLLSLGGGRIVAPAGSRRLNGVLAGLGYRVIEVGIDQFLRCGGGVHCLTLPLARRHG
jgi:arginine deiminase